MLPASYQLPAAAILLGGGIISCFFGYRLFRTVLAIFGFILGALAASSLFGVSDTGLMLIAAVVGGLVGAFVLIAAYFVGVALVGAGLGAVIANLVFSAGDRDPSVRASSGAGNSPARPGLRDRWNRHRFPTYHGVRHRRRQ